MKQNNLEKISNKLVTAFLKNKLIKAIPNKYTKKRIEAQKLRKLCESKIKLPVIGFKAAASFGDLCSDFGANVKFLIGAKKKYKRINIGNLKTNISNKKINQSVSGNTNTVYINPLNSLRFVLNKVKKDKINLNKDFWVFTGSSVGVVPIKGKGLYTGKVDKLGSVKAVIR